MRVNQNPDSLYKALAVMFFPGNAFCYIIAGVLHQTLRTMAESDEQEIWWNISVMLNLVGSLGICLIAVKISSGLSPLFLGFFYSLAVLFHVAATAYVVATFSLVGVGVTAMVGLVLVVIAYLVQCEIFTACGCIIVIAGFLS